MPSTPVSVSIHVVHTGGISPERVTACLTHEERARAARFKFEKDATQWAGCRAALREILGRALGLPPSGVPLVLSEAGKPELAPSHHGLYFNLSHCDGLALVATCNEGPVGIDLEPLERAPELLECEATFCHPDEIRGLPADADARSRQLLRIWTAKEAILKAIGTGLTHPPEAVTLHFEGSPGSASSDIPLEGFGSLRFRELEHSSLRGFQAFLASGGQLDRIRFVEMP